MTIPPDRQREIAEIERIYQAAFVALGLKSAAESLDLWRDVPPHPSHAATAITRYIDKVLKVAGLRRSHAKRLAIPYYRLIRALWTGSTIQDFEVAVNGQVREAVHEAAKESLDDLRKDFYKQVEALAPEAMPKRPKSSGDGSTTIDKIKDIEKKLNDLDKLIEQITRSDLAGIGGKAVKDLKAIDREQRALDVDQQSEDLKKKQGSKAAATVEKNSLDAARHVMEAIGLNDPKAVGFMRVHTNPIDTPCGWCAMLMGRGLQVKYGKLKLAPKSLYNSSLTATGKGSDHYHNNCHCRAVPIFSLDQVEEDPQFSLNRQYATEWPQVTSGLSGKQALSKWRKHIRAKQNK